MSVGCTFMRGGNDTVQRDILSKLALHAQLHPARADYVGVEGCTPIDAPMGPSSRLMKENRSWMTDTELAGTNQHAAVEGVRRAGLQLWRIGEVECTTIRRSRTRHADQMWRMAFRLRATEEDRAFCAAWDEWFCQRDEALFESVCKSLTGKRSRTAACG